MINDTSSHSLLAVNSNFYIASLQGKASWREVSMRQLVKLIRLKSESCQSIIFISFCSDLGSFEIKHWLSPLMRVEILPLFCHSRLGLVAF